MRYKALSSKGNIFDELEWVTEHQSERTCRVRSACHASVLGDYLNNKFDFKSDPLVL